MVNLYKFFLLFIFLFIGALDARINYSLENTNYSISQESALNRSLKTYHYNYNRTRLKAQFLEKNFFSNLSLDAINYYDHNYLRSTEFSYLKSLRSDTPFSTQSTFNDHKNNTNYAKLHRLYLGYEDDQNLLKLGLQNITMGVGRFWSPTNLFNPKNIYALEADETFGVMAINYTRYLNDTTSLHLVGSLKENKTHKYALRYKTFLNFGELALNMIHSDTTKMIGYELEANLFDSGVELRSEGAFIDSDPQDGSKLNFYQGILGAEYGFVNGLNLSFEALYSSHKFKPLEIQKNLHSDLLPNMTQSNYYAGVSTAYTFNIFLDGSLLYIENFNSHEDPFASFVLNYTLNDYNTFTIGLISQKQKTYYLRYHLAF